MTTTSNWTSIDIIDSKVRGRLKLYNEQGRIDPDDIVENTIVGLQAIGTAEAWDEKWACINIVKHGGQLPDDIYKVILAYKVQNVNAFKNSSIFQIVTNTSTTSTTATDSISCDPITTTTTTTTLEAEDCETGEAVLVNTANPLLSTTELIQVLDMSVPMYYGGSNLNILCNSNDNVFITNCDSYIIAGGKLTTSFQEGIVFVNYLGLHIDDDGRPMVPDDGDLVNALVAFNIFRIIEEDFYNRVEGINPVYAEAKTNWENFRAFAQNNAKLTSIPEAYQRVVDTAHRYDRFRLRNTSYPFAYYGR